VSEEVYWVWRGRPKVRRVEWEPFCEQRARERAAEAAYPRDRGGDGDDPLESGVYWVWRGRPKVRRRGGNGDDPLESGGRGGGRE